MKTTRRVFKIRNPRSGLFSAGGMWPSFTKRGKEWPSLGALKNHITQIAKNGTAFHGLSVYNGCELLEITLTESSQGTHDLQAMIAETKATREKKVHARKVQGLKQRQLDIQKELARLTAEAAGPEEATPGVMEPVSTNKRERKTK